MKAYRISKQFAMETLNLTATASPDEVTTKTYYKRVMKTKCDM
jgi:hypothetical protein